MAEPVKVDTRLPILAVVGAFVTATAAFYAVKGDVDVLRHQQETHKVEINRIKQDAELSRDRMNSSVQDLRIAIIRIEAGSKRIEEKLDELLEKKRP